MLTLPPNAATGKLWIERLPTRTRQIIVVAVAGIVAVVLLSIIGSWYHYSRPEYVLEVLDRINTRSDAERESGFLTPQGQAIIFWIIDKRGDKPPSTEKLVYDAPAISVNECTIPFHSQSGTGSVRLLKTDRWRFDDFYIDQMGNRKVELWVSYMKDHPIGAWWSIHGGEMFDAFCKGALIGASVAR